MTADPRPWNGSKRLAARAWRALVILFVVMALLLFVTAGTVGYWQAWIYLAVFTGGSAFTTLDLLKRDPALLERRMRGGPTAETRPVQQVIMLVTSLAFIALLVVPALDHRRGESTVSAAVVLAGDALVALGLVLILRVYRENSFTSATIDVVDDQRVVSTGPYAVVRHPMYASAIPLFLGTPLALGSYRGLLPAVAMLPFLIWRLLDEEHLLAAKLPGYDEYRTRVRYRLVPFIW